MSLSDRIKRYRARENGGDIHAADSILEEVESLLCSLRDCRSKIDAFRTKSEEESYTDSGEAWELLDDVDDVLKGRL